MRRAHEPWARTPKNAHRHSHRPGRAGEGAFRRWVEPKASLLTAELVNPSIDGESARMMGFASLNSSYGPALNPAYLWNRRRSATINGRAAPDHAGHAHRPAHVR